MLMDNPVVTVNSTPIILLHKIGHLDLLKKMYSKVLIAEAVHQEVIVNSTDNNSGYDFISQCDWIEVIKIKNESARKTFVTSLHIGEVETMILAMEKSAYLCVLDDLLARKHAKRLNMNVIGTLGILIAAKKLNHIDAVKPLIDLLVSGGMYLSDSLYDAVLSLANEV